MGRQLVTIRSLDEDFADLATSSITLTGPETNAVTATDDFNTPSWARYATFYLNNTVNAGTTNTLDWKLSYLDPLDKSTATDYPGSGITQITAAGAVIIHVDPIAADDDVAPIYTLHSPLPPILRSTFTLGTKSENEIQTISLSAGLESETFKLTFNAHESTAAVTIPSGGFANVSAAQIKTCLLTISDWTTKTADIAVVKAANDYAVTFTGSLANADIGAITITSKTGAADGSVAETNKGVAGDETYTATLAVVYHA